MSWITAPFAWLLKALYELTGSYGWAVILFGVVVNLILLPFMAKSKKSMMRMSRVSGQMQELQKRYAKNQAKLQEEMQKLYEESNTGYVTYCRRMLDISKFSADAQLSAYCRTVEKLYKAYVKKHGKPDILHAHVTVPAGYAAAKLGEKYHIPVVITEHSSYFERFFEGSTAKYGLYAARHSVMTCVSGYMTDILGRL